jgi:hypothetical protein
MSGAAVDRTVRRGRPLRRRVIGLVAGANAVTALGGAVALAAGWLSLGDELTRRLPWGSPVLGGVALAVLVGLPNLGLTGLALRHDPRTAPATVAVGAVLIGWIVVEIAFLRVLAGLQVGYALVGILMVWLGLHEDR